MEWEGRKECIQLSCCSRFQVVRDQLATPRRTIRFRQLIRKNKMFPSQVSLLPYTKTVSWPSNEMFIARKVNISDVLSRSSCWAALLGRSPVGTLSPTGTNSAFWNKQKSLCLLFVVKLNISRLFEDSSHDRTARPLTIPTDGSGSCLICQHLSLNVTARNGHNTTDVVN